MIRGRRARSRARTSGRRTRTRLATHPGGVQPRTGRSRPRSRARSTRRARRRRATSGRVRPQAARSSAPGVRARRAAPCAAPSRETAAPRRAERAVSPRARAPPRRSPTTPARQLPQSGRGARPRGRRPRGRPPRPLRATPPSSAVRAAADSRARRTRARRRLRARARRRSTRRESGDRRATRARRRADKARRTAARARSASARASRAWRATLAALAPRGRAESSGDDELVARAAVGAVPGLSRAHARRLIGLYGSARALAGAGAARLAAQVPRKLATAVARAVDARAGERALALAAACGVRAVAPESLEFPAALREIPDPPLLLWLRGELSPGPALAIVGSRRPSARGVATAHAFAAELSRSGVAVVSGLAYGIDAAAHEGALAGPGRTLAVLASGLDPVP